MKTKLLGLTFKYLIMSSLGLFLLVFIISFFWTTKGNWLMSLAVSLAFAVAGGLDGAYYTKRRQEKEEGVSHSHGLSLFLLSLLFVGAGLLGSFGASPGAVIGRTGFFVVGGILLITSLISFLKRSKS